MDCLVWSYSLQTDFIELLRDVLWRCVTLWFEMHQEVADVHCSMRRQARSSRGTWRGRVLMLRTLWRRA